MIDREGRSSWRYGQRANDRRIWCGGAQVKDFRARSGNKKNWPHHHYHYGTTWTFGVASLVSVPVRQAIQPNKATQAASSNVVSASSHGRRWPGSCNRVGKTWADFVGWACRLR